MMFADSNLDQVVTQKEEQLTKNNNLMTKLKNAYLFPGKTKFKYEELNKKFGLLMFTKPLIMQAITMLESKLTDIEERYSDPAFITATGISAFLPSLHTRLSKIITRTMILELNIAKLGGELTGDNSKSRFKSFVKKLEHPEFALQLLNEYPVLAHCIDDAIEQWSQYCFETLSRLQQDHVDISEKFSTKKTNIGQLQTVTGDQGDSHNNGRCVTILEFTSGLKVVYKPRPLDIDEAYNEFIIWLNNQNQHLNFKYVEVLNQSGYGWCEFIDAKPLSSAEDAETYYYRFGCLLSIMHLLGATDMHFENIIANGDHPIIVDLETLLHPQLTQSTHYNLLSVGMLPNRLWHTKEQNGVDFGGISAGRESEVAIPFSGILNYNTDEMIWGKTKGFLSDSQNIPYHKDAPLTYENYNEHVINGYKDTYKLLLEQKTVLLSFKSTIQKFVSLPVRYIVRATQYYKQLLSASYHPDLLRDKDKRSDFLKKNLLVIADSPVSVQQITAELSCLKSGNVPLLYSYAESRGLYRGNTLIASNYFYRSGKECLQYRLTSLGQQQLNNHICLITSVLTQSFPEESKKLLSDFTPKWPDEYIHSSKPEALIAAAKNIGDYLINSAIISNDDVTWLGYHQTPSDWVLDELGLDLYNGRLGPILFLAYLAEISGEEKFKKIAELSIDGLIKSRLTQTTFTSLGFSGWGGYIYVLACLRVIWDKPELDSSISSALKNIEPLIHEDNRYDVIGGNAGCILSLLTLAKLTHFNGQSIKLAQLCGNTLLTSAQDKDSTFGWPLPEHKKIMLGFAHGNSGIALALEKLAGVTKDLNYLLAAKKAIAYENSHYSPEAKNWPDLRKSDTDNFKSTWCHGAAGITLSRCLMTEVQTEDEKQRDLTAGIHQLLFKNKLNNHSLCHGLLGNLDILHTTALTTKSERLKEEYQSQLTSITEMVTQQGWLSVLPTQQLEPSFMNGLSGMGYALLKFAKPEKVPNVLALSHI